MALLKKTVVLTNNGAEGYITIVRVGDEVGAKIVGESFLKGMQMALKIGSAPVIYSKLDGSKTELNLNVMFSQNDEISCLIMQDDILIAKAGKPLSKQELKTNLADVSKQTVIEDMPQKKTTISPKKGTKSWRNSPPNANIKEYPQNSNVTEQRTQQQEEPLSRGTDVKETYDASLDNDTEKEFLSRLHTPVDKNFYQNVKERLDDLFEIHPRETELEKVVPDSRWVKIKYDGDDYYVVGSLSDNGVVAYLAYGVPGVQEVPPPRLASDISDWLPVPNLPSPYQGYWLIFQDASNGKVGNLK